MEKIAVIDLGSNSIRMSIFGVDKDGKFIALRAERSMVKLSEGMNEEMMLQEKAKKRTIKALAEYKNILANEGVENIIAVATAAVRKALNGAEFVERAKAETGICIEVIDGEKEAYYDFLAIRHLGIERGIICDIGGGSTELIDVSGDAAPKNVCSIPIGSRVICERFFANGESHDAYCEAEKWFGEKLSEVKWLSEMRDIPLIGIGGTLRALAKYDLKDGSKAQIKMHGIVAARMDEICNEISSASLSERKGMAGIGTERANIIMGGIIPFMCIKDAVNSPVTYVADVGVREGVLLDFLKRNA